MRVRGKVLREPGAAPGLLMIDGQQFRFWLDGIWHSDLAPKPGLVVNVELNRELQVVGITVIPEAHEIEHPQAPVSESPEKSEGRTSRLIARIVARLTGTFKNENPAA